MKNILVFLFTVILTMNLVNAQKVEKLWETTDTVLLVPESVLFADSIIFVSSVSGNPKEKDGTGFISKLSLQGEVLEKEWAKGINAPKGMGVSGGFLFVSDIDQVHAIDLISGKLDKSYDFSEAKFLNDIAVSPEGKVFVSDSYSSCIYCIEGGISKILIKDTILEGVNGLFFDNGYLLAGTKNGVFKIDKSGKIASHFIKNTGGIDGIERVTSTQLIITDWAGKVQLISPNETSIVLLDFKDKNYNAADLGINKKEHFIFIPTFFGNTVVAYKINIE